MQKVYGYVRVSAKDQKITNILQFLDIEGLCASDQYGIYGYSIGGMVGFYLAAFGEVPPKVVISMASLPDFEAVLENASSSMPLKLSAETKTFEMTDDEENLKLKEWAVAHNPIDYLEQMTNATCTEAELIEALNQSGDKREYFVVELTVPYITEGSKEAEISLDPDSANDKSDGDFVYVDGNTYTIVELPNGSTQSGNQDFTCKYMSDSVSGKTVETNVISFKSSGDDYILVSANNAFSQEEGHYELPITGGSGKGLYTLLGLALLCGAGLTFSWRRSKRRVL